MVGLERCVIAWVRRGGLSKLGDPTAVARAATT
ncbi:Uncharacterised protein [Vibrio cholerae]|nr:Uncharacterised protein [Vibrio cholerae]